MLSIKKLTAFAGRALKRVFVRIQGAAPAGLLGLALVACESSPPTDSVVAAAASAPAAAASTAEARARRAVSARLWPSMRSALP